MKIVQNMLSQSRAPPPVYLSRHWHHSCDKNAPRPFPFVLHSAIKNWTVGRPENVASMTLVKQNSSVYILLTSACWVHSNVYGLGNIHCIRYLTAVDPFFSTSSAVQMYHHLTSGSVEIPFATWTGNSSFIGEVPVPSGTPTIRRSATSS